MEGTLKNVKPSKQRKMDPIKFCSILSVMLGVTTFLVVVEASQASQVPPSTKTFEARMTVNETYEPGHSNSSSEEFKTFATTFSQTVGEFLRKKLFDFERVEVKKLANGSVVVDFEIVVLKSSNATVYVIVQVLEGGDPSELGYTILGNVSVNATDQQSTSSIPSPTANVAAPSQSTSALLSPPTSPSPSISPQSISALPAPSTSPSPSTSPQSTSALPAPSTSPSPSTSPQSTSALPSPPTSPSPSTSPQTTSALPSPSPSPSQSRPPSLQTPPPPPPASSTSSPSSFSASSLSASLSLYSSSKISLPSSASTPAPSKTGQSTTPSTEGSKEFKGSGSIDIEWDSNYANSSTPAYKRLSRDLKDHLSAVLKKSYEDNFIGVEVANFREGSIKFDFTVYLRATTIVDEDTLRDVIQKGEGGSNFTITGVSVKQFAGPKPTTSTTVPTEGSKEFKGSGSIDNGWDSNYANSSTPAYKRLSRDLTGHLTAVLKKSYEDNLIGVEVANFREGSIKFDFTIYLKATTIVDEDTLKDVIQKGEGGSNFTITVVSVKQIAGPKPTTSTTEKPEAESGLEKWKIVLIATVPVIAILVIALLVVVHQNRRLSSMHKRNFPVSDYSRSVQSRMYSTSLNTKEMYQLTGPGAENGGSRISRGLTTFSPDNEDVNGTSNRAFVKMEGDKSERDNQSLDGSKSNASDKDSVHYSPEEGFI